MAGTKISAYRPRNSTADRTLDILLLFDDARPTVSALEVTEHIGVTRSSAYRYLQSLVSTGFIEEADAGAYRLGPRVLELARLARRSYGLSTLARPVMLRLAAEVGETVLLTRRSGAAVVCLEREEAGAGPVRLSYERGHILPVNAGAAAYTLLAWEPDDEIDAVLAAGDLTRSTERTLTTTHELKARFAEIRAAGYAVSRGELDPDVLGVAAPVRNDHDTVIASISVAALSRRITDERLPDVVARVCRAAADLTEHVRLVDG
ncbi:IclR family transcriptional regulator [Virgisporangium aurantiacum]|uniref:Glycerol operon regulatory protein n=1 Tax=Virgisporangium aurantiacum TaxID=175570 RepID=A0A8J3Z426_9ACTN|nr:IclR family transcriptional regulator [Virgisporangium aurantiacum]GIJ56939.1 IclR family transcriptional regulator [Virgisporangium aurantiacum]